MQHGGKLSTLYVEEHIVTLRKSIRRRIDELSAIADLATWNEQITFVAHQIAEEIPPTVTIRGLNIGIRTMTFVDFFNSYAMTDLIAFSQALELNLLTPLQEQRTPNEVRQKLIALI